MRLKLLSCFCFFITGFMVVAQSANDFFSLGIGYGGTNYSNLGGTSFVNLRAQVKTNEGEAYFIGVSFDSPYKLNYNLEAMANDFSSTIKVPYNVEYFYYNSTINYLYSLSNEDEPLYYYFLVGFGGSLIKNKYTVNQFDKTKYYILDADKYIDHELYGFNIDLGLGVNFTLDRFKIFGEVKMALIRTFGDEKYTGDSEPIFNSSALVGLGYTIIK